MKQTVAVGMSGGVDSSVSALLLKQQGYQVIGLFMKNWEENDETGRCKASKEFDDVAAVCDKIGIPYYSINFIEEYKSLVFNDFLKTIQAGFTPNPDILCNREIKFDVFLTKAKEIGADLLATGHYCQTDGHGHLLKGLDPNKDQSYFLHAVKNHALETVLFPIGHLHKTQVREIARANGLSTAEKKDSTGICFIGKRDFKPFLSQYIGIQKGPFKTLDGQVVGEHDGMAFYTIGQRKGMGLGGEGDAWFVVGKDIQHNIVYVERGADHPALYATELIADQITWIKEIPSAYPYRCTAKIRYRQEDQPCFIEPLENDRFLVKFDTAQRAISPGQSVVFYQDQLCLGGGCIKTSHHSPQLVY